MTANTTISSFDAFMMKEKTNNGSLVVHLTWAEKRKGKVNDKLPMILAFRRKWENLGFTVSVTRDESIRSDIQRFQALFPSENFLSKYDNLSSRVMQIDFWRLVKLYLEGGVYADADIEPLPGIVHWARRAQTESKSIFFQESSYPDDAIHRFLIPLLSDYTEHPSYANCIMVAPGPGAGLFLELLNNTEPERWLKVRDPRRTLMTAGPGHVTQFIKYRSVKDFLKVDFRQRQSVYIHHGFGSWKSWAPKEYNILMMLMLVCVVVLLRIYRGRQRAQPLLPKWWEAKATLLRRIRKTDNRFL